MNQKPGWVLILLAWLPSGTLRSPRILSFTNPELSVCYEDLSAEAGGYCMFHLIVCSLDMQLTYNYKKSRHTVYVSLFALWFLALQCWGVTVRIHSSFYFFLCLSSLFSPSPPLCFSEPYPWDLLTSGTDLRAGGAVVLSALLPALDHFPALLV